MGEAFSYPNPPLPSNNMRGTFRVPAKSSKSQRYGVITDTQRTSMADQVTHQSNSQNTEQTADLTELISTGWDLPSLWEVLEMGQIQEGVKVSAWGNLDQKIMAAARRQTPDWKSCSEAKLRAAATSSLKNHILIFQKLLEGGGKAAGSTWKITVNVKKKKSGINKSLLVWSHQIHCP